MKSKSPFKFQEKEKDMEDVIIKHRNIPKNLTFKPTTNNNNSTIVSDK